MGVAEAVDGQAADEFHHQVRQAGLGDAAIDQARDFGMIEAGQELALAAEALFDLGEARASGTTFTAAVMRKAPSARSAR
jgi:hypothetical protein